jgi:hypothetical protein
LPDAVWKHGKILRQPAFLLWGPVGRDRLDNLGRCLFDVLAGRLGELL